ncbi:hypothetical protein FHG87_006648 [Trinorchestia longiramus]|nr:hypothetical protein FHG87_006648 [Trinorchestia longiramus]
MSARECLTHPWMKTQVTRPPPPTTLDLPAARHALPTSPTPIVSRAESSPSVIVTTESKSEENKNSEEPDNQTPSSHVIGRPPLHPRSSLKSMSAATEGTSVTPTNPSTPGATLPGITPFLNKESRMGSRQNLNRLRTMSKSREVLSERIQMSNLKKTLSKSRERLYDAKLGLSTSREDLLTCQSLSQSVEALTALSQLHQNGALYKSCNNIFIPMIHLVNKESNMPDRMYKSMASIDQIPGNDLSKTMGYFESRLTGDDDYNDVITRHNTNLNTVISDSPTEATQRSMANEEARLGGLRGNPCRGGRNAEGNDRICPRHSHKQPEPQATQKINKMSRADKMKKDAQRRRKEREQREKERNRKTSLIETKTQEGSTSPTVRRGSVCHVELRLQERHERLMEKQERDGRKISSTGSRRLSSIDSDKSPGPDATKPSSRKSSTHTAKHERSRSITPTRRRSSKVESPKSSDVSEASSMESVSGSLESIQSKGTDKRRKSKQLVNSRRLSTTTKMEKSNDENDNVIKETSSLAPESAAALNRDPDEAYNSLEEGSRETAPEVKSDGDADSVESDRTCTGSVVEIEEPSTPTEEIRIITTKAQCKEDAQNITEKEVETEEEKKDSITSKPCSSSLEVPGLGDIQESGAVKYTRSTSTTSDLGGSICEESEESSDQALSEIEMKIFENKARARSLSVHSKPALSVLPRVRNRSNSVHQSTAVTDRARPWGEICSGSVAKALKNFAVPEEQEELNVASDFAKRRQSSPPHFLSGETGCTEVALPQCEQ